MEIDKFVPFDWDDTPNLLHPNKSTPTPKRYKKGGYSYSGEADSVNGGFGRPPPWGHFLRSTCVSGL